MWLHPSKRPVVARINPPCPIPEYRSVNKGFLHVLHRPYGRFRYFSKRLAVFQETLHYKLHVRKEIARPNPRNYFIFFINIPMFFWDFRCYGTTHCVDNPCLKDSTGLWHLVWFRRRTLFNLSQSQQVSVALVIESQVADTKFFLPNFAGGTV